MWKCTQTLKCQSMQVNELISRAVQETTSSKKNKISARLEVNKCSTLS